MQDINKIKSLFRRIDNLNHENKNDKAYYDAQEISMELLNELSNNNSIKLDINILKKYKINGSEKSKKYIIDEFKENVINDIIKVISLIENNLPNDHLT